MVYQGDEYCRLPTSASVLVNGISRRWYARSYNSRPSLACANIRLHTSRVCATRQSLTRLPLSCLSVLKHQRDFTNLSLTSITGATLLGQAVQIDPEVLLHGAGDYFVPVAVSTTAHRARLSPGSLFVMTYSGFHNSL